MQSPTFWYLQDLKLGERLSGDVLAHIRETARLERWGHQADIYRAAADDDVTIVLEGKVWLQDRRRADEIALEPGDVFGKTITAEITGQSLVLRAHNDTLLAVLSRREFRQQVVPHLGQMRTRVGRFFKRRDIWVPVQPLLFASPRTRLAKVLLHLVETDGVLDDDGHGELAMGLKPRKLADLSGVDSQRVRRVIESLEHDNVVELGRGQTRIWDLDTLRRIAQQL